MITCELIVATDINYGIAKDGKIPWKYSKDLQFFKNTTLGHVVCMGKNTFLSLPNSKPLNDRFNIVFTKTPQEYNEVITQHDNVFFTDDENILDDEIFLDDEFKNSMENNMDEVVTFCREKKFFIIGGKQIYEKFYDKCNVIWFTKIKSDYQCDLKLDMDKILKNFLLSEIIEDNSDFTIYKYIANK